MNRTSVKDGSITVGNSVEPGARLQLFVRDRSGDVAFVFRPNVVVCTTVATVWEGHHLLFSCIHLEALRALLFVLPRNEMANAQVVVLPHVALCMPRDAAGSEFSAALLAYKRRELMETLASTLAEGANDEVTGDAQQANQNVGVVDSVASTPSPGSSEQATPFRAAGALIFPGLDRGRTLWEEDHFQSSSVLKTVPVPLGGFFTNGVAGESEMVVRDTSQLQRRISP